MAFEGGGAGGGAAPPRATRKKSMAMPRPVPAPAPSRARNLNALAAVAVEAGATRYDLPAPVTVPDKSATMVLVLDKKIPGESIFLFAPDGGVPASVSHPFRVARFTNKTGGLLEKGPLAIFSEGAFLGQGMVDPLPDAATATVPFALERGIVVEQERRDSEEASRLAHIEASALTLERDHVARTTYRLKNGGDKASRVLLKHARMNGARLVTPPAGTEDNLGTGTALVPADAKARATSELVVEERLTVPRNVDRLSDLADEAVTAYLADQRADPKLAVDLRTAWSSRRQLIAASNERQKLMNEQSELARSTEETRNNIKALEKNTAAADLRAKLTDRLGRASARLEEITKRMVEVDLILGEQRVRFQDALRGLKLDVPLGKGA
jgi:hypothetical protein